MGRYCQRFGIQTCLCVSQSFSFLELKDLTKDIEGLTEYRSEVLTEIHEKLEEKEKVVNDVLKQTAD